jgi:exopolysaccharide production protein ExoZ
MEINTVTSPTIRTDFSPELPDTIPDNLLSGEIISTPDAPVIIPGKLSGNKIDFFPASVNVPVIVPDKSPANRISSLQALRSFAAMFVMFFHGTQMINQEFGYLFLNNIFIVGFTGVDIFFVLSGFIIFYTSNGKKLTRTTFLKKRFIRIYPIYWVIISLLIFSYLVSPSDDKNFRDDLEIIAGSFLLFPQPTPVMGISWTLTYEVIFYLLFAFTFFKKPKHLFYSFAIWISIIIVVLMFNLETGIFSLDVLFNPIIINFSFGCLVAYFYKKYPTFKYYKLFIVAGLLYFLIAWIIYYYTYGGGDIESGLPNDQIRVLMFGVPAALFMYGFLYARISVNRLLIHLGDASYSLYLLHGAVLSAIIQIIFKFKLNGYFAGFLGSLLIFVLTVTAVSIFYLFVERPLLRYLNRRLLQPKVIQNKKVMAN